MESYLYSGASIHEVQSRLGHGDFHTTMNIYAHVTEKQRERLAERFANYVNFLGLSYSKRIQSKKKGIETLLNQGFYPLYFYSHSMVAGGLLVIS